MIPIHDKGNFQNIKIGSPVLNRKALRSDRRKKRGYSRLWFMLRFCVLLAFVFSCLLCGIHGVPLVKQYRIMDGQMGKIVTGQYQQLFSAPFLIKTGMNVQAQHLYERLENLGYKEKNTTSISPGEYGHREKKLFVHLNKTTARHTRLIVLDLRDQRVELITEVKSGRVLSEVQLGRTLLTSFLGSVWEVRYPIKYKDYPQALLHAVLSAEDKNFYTHHGIAPRSIIRAAWSNLLEGRVVQGGSTITQQLVKTLIQRKGRDFKDKIYEGLLAVVLELHYSKEEILTAYLNTLYMGQTGPFALQGMGAAAKHLLGTEVEALTVRQSAMLAGIIRAPNSLSPMDHLQHAELRAQTVLEQMERNGYLEHTLLISATSHNSIKAGNNNLLSMARYYQQVEKELAQIDLYGQQKNKSYGMEIQLGLDPFMQKEAQQVLNHHLERLESRKQHPGGRLQGAVAAIDPSTGTIRTLIGGRDFLTSQFNRATSARRQIGSLVKPFVYLAAMSSNENGDTPLTQASLVNDTPLRLKIGNTYWSPKNFDKSYRGQISLRQALADSRNIPAVRMGLRAGAEEIGTFIKELGINTQPATGPALFLGAVESSPVKMAAAYTTLANGGYAIKPTVIEKIIWQKQCLYKHPAGKRTINEKDAYVMTDMLREVFDHGTAKSAKKYGLPASIAGKTGTSNKLKDGWFAGYSPTLTAVVWVGLDNNRKMGLTGAASGLPIWGELMAKYGGREEDAFIIPDGVEFAAINRGNGEGSIHNNRETVQIAFTGGTAPSQTAYQQVATIRKELRKQSFQTSSSVQRYKYFR